ncbi:hypothetical protein ACFT55_10985, partial [Isoptericola sp. NPDC057191]
FGEAGGAGEEFADKIMHGMLTTPDGFTIMGSDGPPGMEYAPGNNFAVSLSGEEEDTLRRYWEKLSDGARLMCNQTLQEGSWSGEASSARSTSRRRRTSSSRW